MAAQPLIPGLIPDCSKIIESLSVRSQISGVNKATLQKGEKEIEKKRDTEGDEELRVRESDSESAVYECLGLLTAGCYTHPQNIGYSAQLFKGEECPFFWIVKTFCPSLIFRGNCEFGMLLFKSSLFCNSV